MRPWRSKVAGVGLAVLLTGIGVAAVPDVSPASAADGTILRTITAQSYDCSVGTGIAFDGTNLLLSCDYNNVITAINPIDGSFIRSFTISGVGAIGALAWDRARSVMWACGGFGGDDTVVYRINLGTDTAVEAFGGTAGCPDGLAYDGTDDSLYLSADVASVVQHYKSDGTLLGTINVSSLPCGNSGLAVGGPYLFLANDGCSQIYRASKADLSTLSLFGSYGARLEDMECDDITFQAAGKAAIWSKDAYDGVLNAFELNPGDCGFGGRPPGPLTSRYLVLGDSIPYGHGLANPTLDTHDGLPPNQGPSKKAYPELLVDGVPAVNGWSAQAGLPGLSALRYRPTSCDLIGSDGGHYDQLAISGAPAIVNQWTGSDGNCAYPAGTSVPPHKAVFPDETSAANLSADPPALVTLQAGADDIRFGACLAAVLGVPSQFGASNCTVKSKSGSYQVTTRVQTELESLSTGLTATINSIHRYAPNAKILLIDYYQIVPAADTPLTDTAVICEKLRQSPVGGNYRKSVRQQADAIQKELNGAIESVAAKFGDVQLIKLDNLFSGHEMCTSHRWLFDGKWNAAHPTATGQQVIASAILSVCSTLPRQCVGR
jgi:hypothetical protein